LLATHKEGIIALSGCLASEIPELIQKEQLAKARESIDWFKQRSAGEFLSGVAKSRHSRTSQSNRQLIPWAKSSV